MREECEEKVKGRKERIRGVMCAVCCLTRSTRTRVRALLVGLLQYANTPYSDATTGDEKRVMTTAKGTASAHGDSASHPLKTPKKKKPKSKPKPPPVAERKEGKKEGSSAPSSQGE